MVGRWWDVVIGVLVPLQAVVLLVWWLYQARGSDLKGWLDPAIVDNVGTVLLQWAVVFVVLLLANRWLATHTAGFERAGATEGVTGDRRGG